MFATDEEKVATMKKYNLSEEMYEMYHTVHKDAWYFRGGYKAKNMSLGEYIAMMEEQRISHEDM